MSVTINISTGKKGCLNLKEFFFTALFYHDLPCYASCWKLRNESSRFERVLSSHTFSRMEPQTPSRFSGNTAFMQLSTGTQPELSLSIFSQEG